MYSSGHLSADDDDAVIFVILNFHFTLQALANRGAPDAKIVGSDIPVKSLPHCMKPGCGGLLRPHIVWFGENLQKDVLDKAGRYS